MKIVYSILFLIIIFFNPLSSQTIFAPNEYLEYEVSFLGIKLGSIVIETIGTETDNGTLLYNAKCKMDSYRGIPFVDLHATYTSWMDKSLAYSHKFVGNVKWPEGWDYNKIHFDYDNKKITNKHWLKDSLITNDSFDNDKKMNDGCSLFFFARQFSNLKKTVIVPTFIDGIYSTKINFLGKVESCSIDAINYPVSTLYFDGKTNWKGVYGLNGSFEGWFSNDGARIPIKAYMNVYVGKVLIELKKWKREGWKPPKS